MSHKATYSKSRLSDLILVAFHIACDQADVEVAWELLTSLELVALRQPMLAGGAKRRVETGLIAAHERLWQVRRQMPSRA
jgi:hypothetical protein